MILLDIENNKLDALIGHVAAVVMTSTPLEKNAFTDKSLKLRAELRNQLRKGWDARIRVICEVCDNVEQHYYGCCAYAHPSLLEKERRNMLRFYRRRTQALKLKNPWV